MYAKFKREYQNILIKVYVNYSGKFVTVDFDLNLCLRLSTQNRSEDNRFLLFYSSVRKCVIMQVTLVTLV